MAAPSPMVKTRSSVTEASSKTPDSAAFAASAFSIVSRIIGIDSRASLSVMFSSSVTMSGLRPESRL